MEFSTLTALISRAQALVPSRRILLFGSSSLFASFPDVDPEIIGTAVTLDADFFIEPDDEDSRRRLDAELGEDKHFHTETGRYGDFVDLRLSDSFPAGWRDRLVPMPGFEEVFALHPVDMAVSKVAATARSRLALRMGRDAVDRGLKDINTIVALLRAGRLDRAALDERLRTMDYEPALIVECGRVMADIYARVAGKYFLAGGT